uniref:Basic leucine zipper nuclear factor 1 n=1 Tax=Salmo trutta TaxID=8032 RepID=A0A674BUW4_SALTR
RTFQNVCHVPGSVRQSGAPGDGMETDDTAPHSTPQQSPRASPRDIASAPQPPGVLHLGKVPREACVVVEAVRIVVPRAAISRSGGHVADGGNDPRLPPPPLEDLRGAIEKLQNSERRLLQDKEGLLNQLHVQTEVNRELKKLLVASVGDDLQYHFERLAREKNQMILENELERMSIQCDVWRTKFLASRVMAEELTNARVSLQHQTREAQSAITDLLSERDEFSRDMMLTHRSLEQLLVSLQWGRQQTYYPSAQPLSTGELALANHKLAEAINSRLLGKVGPVGSRKWSRTPSRTLKPPPSLSLTSSPSAFLTNKKSIGRFHPYTRYENITFNCCERCSGDILVL